MKFRLSSPGGPEGSDGSVSQSQDVPGVKTRVGNQAGVRIRQELNWNQTSKPESGLKPGAKSQSQRSD